MSYQHNFIFLCIPSCWTILNSEDKIFICFWLYLIVSLTLILIPSISSWLSQFTVLIKLSTYKASLLTSPDHLTFSLPFSNIFPLIKALLFIRFTLIYVKCLYFFNYVHCLWNSWVILNTLISSIIPCFYQALYLSRLNMIKNLLLDELSPVEYAIDLLSLDWLQNLTWLFCFWDLFTCTIESVQASHTKVLLGAK